MSSTTTITKSSKQHLIPLKHIPLQTENPHLILTYDLVRNTETLHYTIKTNQPPSPEREHSRSMKGYFGIMSDNSCELNGNGERIKIENAAKHMLWTPRNEDTPKQEPLWHLRVSVLKDQEGRGDAPSRRFAFKSMHHLTHAANQLESAFSDTFELRKCGVETPDAQGGRVNDGRSENITIEFDSDTAKEGWPQFLERLRALEDEWEREGQHEGLSVL